MVSTHEDEQENGINISITKWFKEFQGWSLPEILIFRLNKTRGLAMLNRGSCDRERYKVLVKSGSEKPETNSWWVYIGRRKKCLLIKINCSWSNVGLCFRWLIKVRWPRFQCECEPGAFVWHRFSADLSSMKLDCFTAYRKPHAGTIIFA